MRKALSPALASALLVASPGGQGWVLFAQAWGVYADPKTNHPVTYAVPSATLAPPPAALDSLSTALGASSLSTAQRHEAQAFLQRYGDYLQPAVISPEDESTLQATVSALKSGKADPALVLSGFYDRMSETARRMEANGTYTDVLKRDDDSSLVAIRSSLLGKTLFTQESKKRGYLSARNTLRRPDPEDINGEVVEAIILQTEKGQANEQRAIYNRRIHVYLADLKKRYYDQPDLARKIADKKDLKITPEQRKAMSRALWQRRQVWMKPEPAAILRYLEKLDRLQEAGALATLPDDEWVELDKIRVYAMAFAQHDQLEMLQKYVLAQLTYYFASVTNTQPKQKKDGTDGLDITLQQKNDLQTALEEYEKGNLEGYSMLLGGSKKFSHNKSADIAPELLRFAGEAFAALSFAVTAEARVLDKNATGEEQDAAIAESQEWLRLAQMQLQGFELRTMATQLHRLKNHELRDHMGLPDPEDFKDPEQKARAKRMKAMAGALVATAEAQYLPQLEAATAEAKAQLLKRAFSGFRSTYMNAAHSYLYDDTLKERLNTLAARLKDIRSLYLALEFEKVKSRYTGYTALGKLEGRAYQSFLNRLPPDVGRTEQGLERFDGMLANAMTASNADAVRGGLSALEPELAELARLLGLEDMPGPKDMEIENQRLSLRQGKLAAAAQDFSSRMRFFDMVNELDIYLDKFASSSGCSEADSRWECFVSLKWLDSGINKATFKKREFAVQTGLKHNPFPRVREAYERLGANKELREQALVLLSKGNFEGAYGKVAGLDPASARKARAEYEADKAKEDPFASLDFDGNMARPAEDAGMVGAAGAAVALFNHLPTYILGYMGTSALFDAAVMSVATAGLSVIANAFTSVGKGLVTTARFIRIARVAENMKNLGRLGKLINMIDRIPVLGRILTEAARIPLEYGGRWLYNSGRSLRNSAGLSRLPEEFGDWNRGRQLGYFGKTFVLTALPNSAKATGYNMMIMTGASAAMTVAQHSWNKQTSQFKDVWDAALQGGVGGLNFGAKAGIFMHFSPVPASAFGRGVVGTVVRGMAESPGPMSSLIKLGAQLWPRTAQGSVAEMGPLGAMSTRFFGLGMGPAAMAGNKAVMWTLGMADGMAKYWGAATLSQSLAQFAHYRANAGGAEEKSEHGVTAHARNLTKAQAFGQTVAHTSWLFVPVSSSYRAEDVAAQREAMAGYNAVMRAGRGLEIESTMKGSVQYVKPSLLGRWGERLFGKKIGYLEVSGEMRQQAHNARMKKEFSPAEKFALSQAPRDEHGKIYSRSTLTERLETGWEGKANEPASEAPVKGNVTNLLEWKQENRPVEEPLDAAAATTEFKMDANSALVTNESITAGAKMFREELRGDKGLRRGIMNAADAYVLAGKGAQGPVTVRGKALKELKEMAHLEELEATAPLSSALAGIFVPGRIVDLIKGSKQDPVPFNRDAPISSIPDALCSLLLPRRINDLVSGRKLETRYDSVVRELKSGSRGENPEEWILSTRKLMTDLIASQSGAQKQALEFSRRTLESDAYVRVANGKVARDITAFKKGKGRLTEARMKASIERLIEVWEKGVFGQLEGKKVDPSLAGPNTTEPQKGKDYVWDIPPEHQFRNLKGDLIAEFRDVQKTALREVIMEWAKGHERVFNKLYTSGGKTLMGFVGLSFLEAYAKENGREGVLFVTPAEHLVAQAQDDYRAFFKGRKPSFEMITYSELMARLAMANERGSRSPFESFHQAWDEGDQPGTTVPTALGSGRGHLSFPKVNPLVLKLREGTIRVWTELYKEFGGSGLDALGLRNMRNADRGFAQKRKALVERFSAEAQKTVDYIMSKEFPKHIDASLYKETGLTADQIAKVIRKEVRHALGPWYKMGVVKTQHGSLKGWIEKIFDGAYQVRSMKNLSKVFQADPQREGYLQFNFGTAFDNLDTAYRTAVELAGDVLLQLVYPERFLDKPAPSPDPKPVNLDFERVGIADLRLLNEEARDAGTVILALSGSMPDAMPPFLVDMGWVITGEATAPTPFNSIRMRENPFADVVAEINKHRALSRAGPRILDQLFLDNMDEYRELKVELKAAGVPEAEQALLVYPGSAFFHQERMMAEVKLRENKPAMDRGEVSVSIWVGEDIRGKDPKYKAYKDGEIHNHYMNPERMAEFQDIQAKGRSYGGRVPESTKVFHHAWVKLDEAVSNQAYRTLASKRLSEIKSQADAGLSRRLGEKIEKIRPFAQTPDVQAPKGAKFFLKPGEASSEAHLKKIFEDKSLENDREIIEAKSMDRDIRQIRKLRETLSAEDIEKALSDPAEMTKLLARPDVYEILLPDMQSYAGKKAQESSGMFREPRPGLLEFMRFKSRKPELEPDAVQP